MTSDARFVVDTNVLVDSVFFLRSFGQRALQIVMTNGELMLSPDIVLELTSVVMRPRWERYMIADERLAALEAICSTGRMYTPWCRYRVCRDPSDDKFFELAVCSGARRIITRDADLLVLDGTNGIRITDAVTFISEFQP